MANALKLFILFSTMMAMLGGYATGRHTTTTPESFSATSQSHKEWFNVVEEEKVTKLHFYIHDFVNGPNKSVYNVAESSITSHSSSYFGQVQVADHLITAEPELGSEKVGRVQGIHVMADLHEPAISVNWNFIFNDGSTITVLGRLVAFAVEGELSIVGGTGQYVMARGIALKRCLVMDPDTWNSIMEYNMYVYTSKPLGMLQGV